MKRILASILTTILIVTMTLAAMFTLVRATSYVTSISSPLHRAFAIAAEVWGAPLLAGLRASGQPIAYPVAIGALAAAQGVAVDPAALAFLHGFAANLVSAAVRLVPLGQTAGLRVLSGLEPTIQAVAEGTRDATLDDLGGACFRSDIAAMRHETQYTRLFRT